MKNPEEMAKQIAAGYPAPREGKRVGTLFFVLLSAMFSEITHLHIIRNILLSSHQNHIKNLLHPPQQRLEVRHTPLQA